MQLLRTQQNQLFKLIQDAGMNPVNFSIQYKELVHSTKPKLIIKYLDSQYEFSVGEGIMGKFRITYSPSLNEVNCSHASDEPFNFETVTNLFTQWLTHLINETSEEDLWEKIKNQAPEFFTSFSDFDSEEEFTEEEKVELRQKINVLRRNLTTILLLPEQVALMNRKLDIVIVMLEKLNKFNWRSFLIGTVQSVVINMAIGQEQGQKVFDAVVSAFNYVKMLVQ